MNFRLLEMMMNFKMYEFPFLFISSSLLRLFLVIPAENTTLVDDHIEMHEIVCNVVETKNLILYRGAVVSVEQEDDDTRIEIEV